jgi:hypothetical protein
MRFADALARLDAELTLTGHVVLRPSALDPTTLDDEQRALLGRVHLRRVELADEVIVVNVGGYVGESTRREIAVAQARGIPVRYLEPVDSDGPGG